MKTYRINTWLNIIKLHDRIYASNQFIFRGQSDAAWELEHSLLRIAGENKAQNHEIDRFEQEALLLFRASAGIFDTSYVFENQEKVSHFMKMQHYGCPTRLLDWTHSFFLALYFACNENYSVDGALFIFNPENYREAVREQYGPFFSIDPRDIFQPTRKDYLAIVKPLKEDVRVFSQQALFTVSNNLNKKHDEIVNEVIEEGSLEDIQKVIIPKENKLEILHRLRSFNITPSSIFPGLDGLGKSIKEKLLIRTWIEALHKDL